MLQQVIFHPNKIGERESLWCIFHKFSLWNFAKFSEIWKIFSKAERTHEATTSAKSRKEFLIDLDWMDENRFKQILGLSEIQFRNALVESYKFDFPAGHLTTETRGLRFCEKCVAQGFHSPVHLLSTTLVCPIHFIQVRNNCPRCFRIIRNTLPQFQPFSCECGHPLWPDKNHIGLNSNERLQLQNYLLSLNALKSGVFRNDPNLEDPDHALDLKNPHRTNTIKIFRNIHQGLKFKISTYCDHRRDPAWDRCLRDWIQLWEEGGPQLFNASEAEANAELLRKMSCLYSGNLTLLDEETATILIRGALLGTFVEVTSRCIFLNKSSDKTDIKGAYIPIFYSKNAVNFRQNRQLDWIPITIKEILNEAFSSR
jgi:hypothetical protein